MPIVTNTKTHTLQNSESTTDPRTKLESYLLGIHCQNNLVKFPQHYLNSYEPTVEDVILCAL